MSVFATKFDPSLEANVLSAYLREKLGRDVKCHKIENAHGRFSSFHISAECNEVAEMYAPELWPAGVFVRRYYEQRKDKQAIATGSLAPVSGTCSTGNAAR